MSEFLLWMTLLVATNSAAGRVTRERERQTLESLMTLPVGPFDILFAKWLGSISNAGLPGLGLVLICAYF